MSHNAPFIVPDAADEAPSPTLSLLFFVIIALAPIVVCGPILQLWDLSLLFSIVGACAVIWICLRSIVSIGFVRRYPFMTEPLMRMFVLIVGIVLLMFPVALYAGIHPGSMVHLEDGDWPVTFFSTIFSTVQAVTLNLTPDNWIEDARELGVLSDLLLSVHALLIIFYAIACPFAAVSAAVDALVNGISDLRIRFWSWRKTHGSTMGEIYVFHELEEHGTALVRSILETRKERMPLIIFANVGDAEASRDETLMEDISDRARGKANVLYTSLPVEAIPHKLSKRALETCAIRYYAITHNSTINIQTCGALWDATFVQLWNKTWRIWNKTYAWQYRQLSPNDYSELCKTIAATIDACAMSEGGTNAPSRHSTDSLDPSPFIPLLRMGDRLSIHCMYTNLVDVALLDTLIEHNVQFIMNRLRGDCEQYRDEIKEGVREVASSLRNLVDMRLLRQAELSVQDLFVRHPLFEVLDPMTLAEDSVSNHSKIIQAKEQQLTVLILGCGDHGIEALKTSFWLGRIARTQLKIVVVDNCDVRQKMEHLFLSSPEMMTERTYSEDVRGPHVGTWSIARRHRTPTVRFCEMDVYGVQMRALLNGEEVRTLWYTDGPKPSIAESTEVVVGNNDHLYCLICLDNDDAELKLALGLQQCLAARKLHAYNEDEASAPVSGRIGDLVPIAIHLRSESILTSEETGEWGPQSGLRNLGFPLYQFGSTASTFTYKALAGNELEEQAIQINALPTLVRHERISHRKGEMDYHGITELAKYRHRSVALSIPYKLWMLGFEPGKVSSRDFQHRLCPGLDSSEIDKADKRFNRSADAAFRAKRPLFAYMGDLEHVRWCAFYRTLGWRDATVMPEKARSLISFDEGASNVDLALCYYLCDDKDELCQRAEKHGDHPHAYGRMLVWHSIDVLNGTVCQK